MSVPQAHIESSQRFALRRGATIIGALSILTLVEYLLAISEGPVFLPILAIGIAKATLILIYFMHIGALRRSVPKDQA